MKLETAIRDLGPVNYTGLKSAVQSVPEQAWLEDTLRQEKFVDFHQQTQTIILLFCDGWPDIKISRRSGWDLFAPHVGPIIKPILETYYRPKGFVIRAMLAKLMAGGLISPHEDVHPSFAVSHRVHVPIITNGMVDFTIGEETFNLKEGVAYEINNLETHGVHNRSGEDRVHFIFDYAEP